MRVKLALLSIAYIAISAVNAEGGLTPVFSAGDGLMTENWEDAGGNPLPNGSYTIANGYEAFVRNGDTKSMTADGDLRNWQVEFQPGSGLLIDSGIGRIDFLSGGQYEFNSANVAINGGPNITGMRWGEGATVTLNNTTIDISQDTWGAAAGAADQRLDFRSGGSSGTLNINDGSLIRTRRFRLDNRVDGQLAQINFNGNGSLYVDGVGPDGNKWRINSGTHADKNKLSFAGDWTGSLSIADANLNIGGAWGSIIVNGNQLTSEDEFNSLFTRVDTNTIIDGQESPLRVWTLTKPVPEPSTMVLLGLAGVLLLARRRLVA